MFNNQGWICQGVGGFDPLGQMVDPPTDSQKNRLGVVNEPHQSPSHLTIQQPTINIGWLCSCVVQSCVLWLLTA